MRAVCVIWYTLFHVRCQEEKVCQWGRVRESGARGSGGRGRGRRTFGCGFECRSGVLMAGVLIAWRFVVFSRLLLQKRHKSGLLEMMVTSQCFAAALLLHDNE
jgi:hypothetical protein